MAITAVQHKQAVGTHTVSVTWTSPTTAGNLLRFIFASDKTSGTVGTHTPPAGLGMVLAVTQTETSTGRISIYYITGAASQTASGTFTDSQATNVCGLEVEEVSGLANGGTLDQTAINNHVASLVNPSTGTTPTTTQAAEYYCAGILSNDAANGPDSYSAPTNSAAIVQSQGIAVASSSMCDLNRIVAATGAYTTGASEGSAGANFSWAACIATFKDNAPAGRLQYARRNKSIRGLPAILATW
jgi:hypothetical protein